MINLKNLNQFIDPEHFIMETITNVRTMLSKDDWIVTKDISDAYLTIPLNEEFKDYAAFQYQDQTYRFLCMPFGLLERCHKGLHKDHEAPCGQSKSSSLHGSSIFR